MRRLTPLCALFTAQICALLILAALASCADPRAGASPERYRALIGRDMPSVIGAVGYPEGRAIIANSVAWLYAEPVTVDPGETAARHAELRFRDGSVANVYFIQHAQYETILERSRFTRGEEIERTPFTIEEVRLAAHGLNPEDVRKLYGVPAGVRPVSGEEVWRYPALMANGGGVEMLFVSGRAVDAVPLK